MPPHYNFDDLISACRTGEVEVWRPALRGAGYFSIRDRDGNKVLEFIAAGGLEGLEHISVESLRSSSDIPPPKVDAYSFWSGGKKGYIAFFYNPNERQWEIKSFKEYGDVDNQLTAGLKHLIKHQNIERVKL